MGATESAHTRGHELRRGGDDAFGILQLSMFALSQAVILDGLEDGSRLLVVLSGRITHIHTKHNKQTWMFMYRSSSEPQSSRSANSLKNTRRILSRSPRAK
jgi:hypothetical protein